MEQMISCRPDKRSASGALFQNVSNRKRQSGPCLCAVEKAGMFRREEHARKQHARKVMVAKGRWVREGVGEVWGWIAWVLLLLKNGRH